AEDTMLGDGFLAKERIMAISERLLMEFDHEMKTTRRTLERMPEGKPDWKPLVAESRKQVLEVFDQKVAEARAAIASASDEQWMKPWKLSMGEQTFYDGPLIGALRMMMMNHLIHHRAQLGVYYRLNDIPLPSTYGPSADEGPTPS